MKKQITLIISLLLILTITGCQKEQNDVEKKQINNEKITPIRIITAIKSKFVSTRRVSGETIAFQDITISSQANGKVEQFNLSIGDYLKKDQIIAVIDKKMAQAQFNQALANYNLAKSTYDRQQILFDKKLISPQTFEQAKTQFDVAKASYNLAKIQIDNTQEAAPFSGIVAETFINQNELISIGRPLIRLVNIDKLKIIIELTEHDISSLSINDKVDIEIAAIKKIVKGTVHKIGVAANKRNKTFPIEIVINNAKNTIKAGMLCSVTFIKETLDNVIVVPQDIILEEESSKGVFIVEDNLAKLKTVKIGAVEGHNVAIAEGLKAGEKVVVSGHKSIVNNQKVKIIEDKNVTN